MNVRYAKILWGTIFIIVMHEVCHALYNRDLFNIHTGYKMNAENEHVHLGKSIVTSLLECYEKCHQYSDCVSFSVTDMVSVDVEKMLECNWYRYFSFMYSIVHDDSTVFLEGKFFSNICLKDVMLLFACICLSVNTKFMDRF